MLNVLVIIHRLLLPLQQVHINSHVVVVEAVSGQAPADDFVAVKELEKLSGVTIPKAVNGLETAEVRHKTVVATSDMQNAVEDYLGL